MAGEEAWEDVEEAEARRQSLGVDAAAAAAAAGESERVGAGEAEVADEVEETSRTGVEMSFVELTAESVQEESSRPRTKSWQKLGRRRRRRHPGPRPRRLQQRPPPPLRQTIRLARKRAKFS